MCSSDFGSTAEEFFVGAPKSAGEGARDILRGKKSFKQGTKGLVRTLGIAGLGGSFGPGGLIAEKMIKDKRDRTTPPAPVKATISTDSDRQQVAAATARAEAERRRRQAAGAQSTIATSPLGITGGQASLGRTSLLGT